MAETKPNNFHRLYLICFFLILALPLLSIPHWFHPAPWAKSILFRIIFSILIFLFIWEILSRKGKLKVFWQKIRHGAATLPCWLLIALFGIFSLATIFSLDPHFSFWGSPYRGGGFLTFGFCIIFAILLFLILKRKDWQKIWDFTLVIGTLVAILAIIQKFGLFSKYLASYTSRPVSTMGSPMFLALYLLLLSFLSISFRIVTKNKKRFLYFLSSILFVFVILLTATKAAFLGLFAGFLFFVFFYPKKSLGEKYSKKVAWLKILTGLILILGLIGIFWLRGQPQLVQELEENKIFGTFFGRIWPSVGKLPVKNIISGRSSGWKVAFEAVKDRPFLGYGPENFSVGFDKYYDPTLPGIMVQPGGAGSTGWWDRGHSFIFDISVSAGIPALIIYLLLFGVLFWQLQKIKRNQRQSAIISGNQNSIIAHGIQATFIGYLAANFFSFDDTSTYLILFLLIGYSLYLIAEQTPNITPKNAEQFSGQSELKPWKYIFLFVLFSVLIWFVWSCNLKPLWVNKEINIVVSLTDLEQCEKAVKKMEKILPSHTFIDNYLRLQYIDTIAVCSENNPEVASALYPKAIQLLDECIKLRPYYTRSWLYLGVYINRFVEANPDLDPETKIGLLTKAYSCFERSYQLSPKRTEVFYGWIRTDILSENYQHAKEKADECLNTIPDLADCWWAKSIALVGLGEVKEATEYLKAAPDRYSRQARNVLSQLIVVYGKLIKEEDNIEYYEALSYLYPKLIEIHPRNFQYHASLAYVYKELGQYDKAREEAMITLELSPESQKNVEAFLESLPPK